MQLNDARETLLAGKGNLRCQEVVKLLERLGFEVRDGRRGGHKIFVHHAIPGFYSGSFNCGHGKNPEIKPAYITRILTILDMYAPALEAYLGEDRDHE